MPTAAKLEKQASLEALEPFRMALTTLEHKIRNLEKRKRKIEVYKEDQSKGQTLNSDQLLAVSKYDEVIKNLDFAQDLYKQFQVIAADGNKMAKKLQRKENHERTAQDISKMKDVLMIQDLLQGMGQDNVREDFLAGRNNAILLTENDLKQLDDLYVEVAPKRSTPDDGLPPFHDQLTAAAEHFLSLVEGKSKDVVGTSYEHLKELLAKIQDCGYFDQQTLVVAPVEICLADSEFVSDVEQAAEQAVEDKAPEDHGQQFAQAAMPNAPLARSLPIPSNLVHVAAAAPPAAATTIPASVNPACFASTSHTSEVPYDNLDQQQSVNDLIKTVSGSFNFLQDSELDTEAVSIGAVALPVSTISSQTYTNQNFSVVQAPTAAPLSQAQPAGYPVGVAELNQPIAGFPAVSPNPPPPIPMPPSHRTNPYAAAPAQAAPALVAPAQPVAVHAVASCHGGLPRQGPARAPTARAANSQAAPGRAGPSHTGPTHPGPVGPAHVGPGHVGPSHRAPRGGHGGPGLVPHIVPPGLGGPIHVGPHVGPAILPPGPGGAAHAGPAHGEFHLQDPAHGPLQHLDAWGALGDATIAPPGAAAVGGGGGGEWNPNAAQAAEWAPPNDGQPQRPLQHRPGPGHRGNRGGSRGNNSPGGYGSRGAQPRQGNFNNGNRNAGSYGNYPRSQEGHAGTGLGNASYYQHQNGYQQQHSQAQQPQQQQQPAQANREQFNTNGNYTSYRSRPAQRAPGTRGSSRGGMANDGGVSNQRAARGTAFVGGGGGGRPHMNRQ